jgi:hypothetical protein
MIEAVGQLANKTPPGALHDDGKFRSAVGLIKSDPLPTR